MILIKDGWLCSDGVMGHVGVGVEDKDIKHMGSMQKRLEWFSHLVTSLRLIWSLLGAQVKITVR